MMNSYEIRREAAKKELENLRLELDKKTKAIEDYNLSLQYLINNTTDDIDGNLVELLDRELRIIDSTEKYKDICKACIKFSKNTINRESRIYELLEERKKVLKAEEVKLRNKFYSGEYDSALVEKMNKISKKITDLESTINNMKNISASDEQIKENEDTMRVTLPISGHMIDLKKISKDEIQNMDIDEITKLATQLILSSKPNSNEGKELYEAFNKVFGDRIQIIKLANDNKNNEARSLTNAFIDQRAHSTKHLLDEISSDISDSDQSLNDWSNRFKNKFNIDEMDHQYGRMDDEIAQRLLTDWFKRTYQKEANEYLNKKRKEQIEEKYSQIPKRFNGYENEIGTYSKDNRNIPMGKLNETELSKTITEIEETIWKKIIEETPKMLAEEMQKVLDKMNK